MESIPKNSYFEFHPNTLQDVRREFDLHQPGAMRDVVASFEEWVLKQNHFTKKDFTKHFLEGSIILAKGSLEKAKKTLDKLCTLRTLIPKFFSKSNVRTELVDLKSKMIPLLLPKLTEDHYRIFMLKVVSPDIDTATWYDYYRLIMLLLVHSMDPHHESMGTKQNAIFVYTIGQMCEYARAHDYFQGFCCIIDVRHVNIANFAMSVNLIDLRNMFTAMLDGYGMRMKGIHFVSESKAVDMLISIMKQVVTEKITKRIQVHKTMDTVYEHIDKDSLPKDYGGEEKNYEEVYDDLLDLLSQKESVEYFKEICQAGTNEAFRQTAVYNNDILGMPGSFRSLKVD